MVTHLQAPRFVLHVRAIQSNGKHVQAPHIKSCLLLWSRSRQKQQASTAPNHIIHMASDHRAKGPDCGVRDGCGTIRTHAWELLLQAPMELEGLPNL